MLSIIGPGFRLAASLVSKRTGPSLAKQATSRLRTAKTGQFRPFPDLAAAHRQQAFNSRLPGGISRVERKSFHNKARKVRPGGGKLKHLTDLEDFQDTITSSGGRFSKFGF